MDRITFKPSGRSIAMTGLMVVCLVETITLLELGRVRTRAGAHEPTPALRPDQGGPKAPRASSVEVAAQAIPAPRSAAIAGSATADDPAPCPDARRHARSTPTDGTIRCRGMIEAKRENVPVGTLVAGVVTEVYVERGDLVKKGDALFRLDDRDFRTQLGIATANLEAAEAQLDRLVAAPKQGDVASAEAAVEEARAHMGDSERAYRRSQTLYERKVESAQDLDRVRYTFIASKANVARLEAELRRIKTTWEKDRLTARAAVSQSRAQLENVQVNLARLVVRAAIDGRVLRVGVRPGQFAGTAWNEPLVILGDARDLVVRADVDESELPRFARQARAFATLKGHPGVVLPLTYFDTEPTIISQPGPGAVESGLDASPHRVLQVLYQLPREAPVALYSGQEMEVAIDPADISSPSESANPSLGSTSKLPRTGGDP